MNDLILNVTVLYKKMTSALEINLFECKDGDFYLQIIKDHVTIAKNIIDNRHTETFLRNKKEGFFDDGIKENDLTRYELQILKGYIKEINRKYETDDDMELIEQKIDILINEYCNHEWRDSAINAIYCVHCQKHAKYEE